jgi:hypothetical protein
MQCCHIETEFFYPKIIAFLNIILSKNSKNSGYLVNTIFLLTCFYHYKLYHIHRLPKSKKIHCVIKYANCDFHLIPLFDSNLKKIQRYIAVLSNNYLSIICPLIIFNNYFCNGYKYNWTWVFHITNVAPA